VGEDDRQKTAPRRMPQKGVKGPKQKRLKGKSGSIHRKGSSIKEEMEIKKWEASRKRKEENRPPPPWEKGVHLGVDPYTMVSGSGSGKGKKTFQSARPVKKKKSMKHTRVIGFY